MWTRDYRDILGGGILILLGLFALIYSLTELRLGSVSRMGPGYFPAVLGVLLAGLGLGILVPAIFRSGLAISIDIRTLLAVSIGVIAFAILVRPFGLIPATVALTFLATRADNALSPLATVVVAACLSLGATLIFRVGLGLQIYPISWPW